MIDYGVKVLRVIHILQKILSLSMALIQMIQMIESDIVISMDILSNMFPLSAL